MERFHIKGNATSPGLNLSPNPDGDWVKAADAQATIAALQARVQELEAIKIPDDAFTYCAYCGEKSPVDEHNEDLSAHIKVCPKHPIRDVEAQLTQRTAELEAAKRERDVWYARYNELSGVKDRQLNDLQAELERVRGEREKYYALIAALPKVEGEIRVEEGKVISVEPVRGADPPLWWRRTIATFEDGLLAKHYSKLLQHRQGMEG